MTSPWLYIAVMAGVTYAIRLIPLLVLRRQIRQPHLRAFLHYVPYATLTAMTVPAAVTDAPSLTAGCAGLAAAILSAFFGVSLLPTAALASLAVWLCGLLV